MDNSRTRAWRLIQNKRNKKRENAPENGNDPREKDWKMLYTRSDKLKRAAQLGIEYPRVTNVQYVLKAKDDV